MSEFSSSPGQVHDPLVGAVVDDRYRVERRIGEGGMGIVYLATHAVLHKRLALKVLRRDLAHDPEVVQRFVQEAQSASGIGHENIVDISDFGRLPDGSVYFVMEYLEGETLGALLARGALPPDRPSLGLVRQLASALGAAHARGIVHRDLKPDNVFLVVRPSGERIVKVLDFGIAKVADAPGKLTRTGMVFGTPHYMSPEQAAGQPVDLRTDVYALGVILYEAFTGRVPFDADTFMGILSKHMFEQPIPPSQIRDALAHVGPLENLILRCLAKRPDDRYPSMEALLADLAVIARGGTLPAVPVSSIPPPAGLAPAPASAGPSRRRWALLAAGVLTAFVTVVGAGAAAVLALRGSLPTTPPVAAPAPPPPARPPAAAPAGEPAADPLPRMVTLESDPPGAEVVVAGAVVGNTPTFLPTPERGQGRDVVVRLAGHRDATVRLDERSPDVVRVALESAPPPAPRRPPPRATAPPRPPRATPAPPPARRSEVLDPWAD